MVVALGLRALLGWSDRADGVYDRADSSSPFAGADPAPCCDVGEYQEWLGVGALVFVVESVALTGGAGELEKPKTVGV